MSLPKTLNLAENRLEQAENSLKLHAQEVIETLDGDRKYRGLYHEETASKAADATTQCFNAKKQFSNYRKDFEQTINKEGKFPEELMYQHDITASTENYVKALEATKQIALRHERLHRQIKGLSQVMEGNDLGSLWNEIREENPWYRKPETMEGFGKTQ